MFALKRIRLLLALVLALGTLGSGKTPVWAQSTDPPDYAIPAGQFFTEALPNRTDGTGFSVQDGHAASLWTAFQAAGGVTSLGYPISRRFEWNGFVAQAFSGGAILKWNPVTLHADTLHLRDLPGGKLPAYAVVPDRPPVASVDVQPTPWSGWWWPASGLEPALYAPDGPLDKYDRYVASTSGEDPGTRTWERQNMYFPGTSWAGHCNGYAAAALLEPEPTEPISLLGITFSVDDLKGLLVDYHFGDAAAWSFGDEGDLSPVDFHRMLLDWMAAGNKGFVLTFDQGGGEVWSYPMYRFESEWSPDAVQDGLWHVKTTVWLADMDVPAGFVGTKPFPSPDGKVFTYDLQGDPRHADDGAWTGASQSGRFAHPGRIWFPEPKLRNDARDLVSPGLDRKTVANIIAGSDGSHQAIHMPQAVI